MIKQCSIRILSVDHHPLFREGIATVIESQPDMVLVAEAANGREALQRFREHRPDVTLMDSRLPDSSGIETMTAIRGHFPEARVILVSTFQDEVETESALQAGASGCILKAANPREMVEVIRQVYSGRKSVPASQSLTTEVEVLAHAAGGNRK